jgi:hypothetical protein
MDIEPEELIDEYGYPLRGIEVTRSEPSAPLYVAPLTEKPTD